LNKENLLITLKRYSLISELFCKYRLKKKDWISIFSYFRNFSSIHYGFTIKFPKQSLWNLSEELKRKICDLEEEK